MDDLSVPYITFFVVAAGASIATIVGKIVLSVQKSRSRGRASARAVAPAIALADNAHEERVAELDKDIEANRLDQRKAYVAALRMRTGYHRLLESHRALQVLRVAAACLRGHSDGYAAATPLEVWPSGSVALVPSTDPRFGAIFIDRCDELVLSRPFWP